MIGLGKLGCMGKMGNVTSGGLMLPEVQASGRAFPIWNTVVGTDKLLSLSIHGLTEQNGTPTPEVPVPMQSVGDSGLLLSIMQDKTGGDYQLLDIGGAMRKAGYDGVLRSAGAVYDEIKYNGKEWTFQKLVNFYTVKKSDFNPTTFEVLDEYSEMYFYLSLPSDVKYRDYAFCNCLVNSVTTGIVEPFTFTAWGSTVYVRLPNTYDTVDKFLDWIDAHDINITYGIVDQGLPNPVSLDLPVISTYDGQTYFATNATVIKPYMECLCHVAKELQFVKRNLIAYWIGKNRKNTDDDKAILPDQSGNENVLRLRNFAYTPNSGYIPEGLLFDGVDDFCSTDVKELPIVSSFVSFRSINNNESGGLWNYLVALNNKENEYTVISPYVSNAGVNEFSVNGEFLNSTVWWMKNSIQYRIYGNTDKSVTQPCILRVGRLTDTSSHPLNIIFNRMLCYSTSLSPNEIEHNEKLLQQLDGIDIDGYALETTASGENEFTIYNSLSGVFDELTVYGKSIQNGTPTPENPVAINSVGNISLIMTITNGTETQQINFGDIKLRSVNGISDELKWNKVTGKWTLIQRIFEEEVNTSYYVSNHPGIGFCDCYSELSHYGVQGYNIISNYFVPGTSKVGVMFIAHPTKYIVYTLSNNGEEFTVDDANNWLSDKTMIVSAILETPIETELEIEAPKTFEGNLVVSLNQTMIQPYMTARTQVSEKLTLPENPLAVYIAASQMSGDSLLKDRSGNGNDMPLYNLAHTPESGFYQGALHLDGIDDTGRRLFADYSPAWDYYNSTVIIKGKSFALGTTWHRSTCYLRGSKTNRNDFSRLWLQNMGEFISIYNTANNVQNTNILGPQIPYEIACVDNELLNPVYEPYFNIAGYYYEKSVAELAKGQIDYIIIYNRQLTAAEKEQVIQFIEQGIYEL